MGNWTFANLDWEQTAKVADYENALETARQSWATNPIFSDFHVKTAIGYAGWPMAQAGNIEYGLCEALHSEEAAVGALRSAYEKRALRGPIILGCMVAKPGNPAMPCGNCRDIMLAELGPDFEIVAGADVGGLAVVTQMKDYLFDNFKALKSRWPSNLKTEILETVQKGDTLMNDAYSLGAHQSLQYHASIVTATYHHFGARDIMVDYHPLYALRDAIRQARRNNDPMIKRVIIVCQDFGGGPPQVMYKDRQHLLELNLQAELISGSKQNPPVFLATHHDGRITNVWVTSIKRWLPMPFTLYHLGPQTLAQATSYFKNKRP